MANITNEIRAWNSLIINVDSDPSIAPGVSAGVGSLAIGPSGIIYNKTGKLDTDWALLASPGALAVPNKYVAYVNKNGNDGTGLVDDITKPFLTVQAAINACVSAGYTTSATRADVLISPGVYTENLSLASNVNLVSLSSQSDITTRITGSHSFAPVSGSIADNTINLIGLYLDNATTNPTISFGGTAASRIRVIDTNIIMTTAASLTPTVSINNSNAVFYVTSNITGTNITRSGSAADAVQLVSGTFNCFGCDIAASTGNALNMSAGVTNFGYGTISGSGAQVINVNGGTVTLGVSQILNSTSNADGILNAGATIVCGVVAFNIAGTTGYCARGTGTFLYNNLTFIGALANARIQNTLTSLAIPSTPSFVA